MVNKQKYIRLKRFDEIIIFPKIIEHSEFKNFGIISAGFCYVEKDQVLCFGESTSLKLKSKEEDSDIATKQFYGIK